MNATPYGSAQQRRQHHQQPSHGHSPGQRAQVRDAGQVQRHVHHPRPEVELRAQREGAVTGPALPIYPETPLSFFWKAVDAQLVFTTDDGGTITGAKFKQGALELSGTRVGP